MKQLRCNDVIRRGREWLFRSPTAGHQLHLELLLRFQHLSGRFESRNLSIESLLGMRRSAVGARRVALALARNLAGATGVGKDAFLWWWFLSSWWCVGWEVGVSPHVQHVLKPLWFGLLATLTYIRADVVPISVYCIRRFYCNDWYLPTRGVRQRCFERDWYGKSLSPIERERRQPPSPATLVTARSPWPQAIGNKGARKNEECRGEKDKFDGSKREFLFMQGWFNNAWTATCREVSRQHG